jgi:hypothetical protein
MTTVVARVWENATMSHVEDVLMSSTEIGTEKPGEIVAALTRHVDAPVGALLSMTANA